MRAKLLAEFIGIFWLVLGGCGSAVLAATFPNVGIGLVGVSLASGLTVLTGVYALGPISGGHFNPAVSRGDRSAGRRAPRLEIRPGRNSAQQIEMGRVNSRVKFIAGIPANSAAAAERVESLDKLAKDP